MARDDLITLRVSAVSVPKKVAGAFAKCLKEGKSVVGAAVGAGASHQLLKALVVTQGMVAQNGSSISWRLSFEEVETPDGTKRTAIVAHPVLSARTCY